MVVFINGHPVNSEYRHYKIKTVKAINDVAMIKEVIHRRYSSLLKYCKKLPDLVVVDGGKGQMNGALSIITDLNINSISVCGIAKKEEIIFSPKNKRGIKLKRNDSVLHLIQHIRDEAHRFAKNYHLFMRKKKFIES